MNRKLKALGLALVVVLAMGSLSASAASAADFHSESGTDTVIKGTQVGTDIWAFNAGTKSCNEFTYVGNQSGATATTWKAMVVWSNCSVFGFVNVTIDPNGCAFELSGDDGSLKIACPEGASIVETGFNCWVTIGPQSLTGVTYANTGSGSSRDLDLSINVSGITYTQHSKSFPGCTNGSFTNGTFTGKATMQGFSTGGVQIGIWRE
jgi:hypothetical protein